MNSRPFQFCSSSPRAGRCCRRLPRAEDRKRGNIAARCFLFEKFVADLLAQEPDALRFKHESRSRGILIHPHCHAKSILNPAFMATLAERLPGRKATMLDTACCGMAGASARSPEKYDLSLQVAQRLLDQIDNQPQGTEVIASGTSCRHQITDLTNIRPKHMAELLAEALQRSGTSALT